LPSLWGDPTVRGFLEHSIYNTIKVVPNSVRVLLNPSLKVDLQIENEKDFVLGEGLGIVLQAGLLSFLATYMRVPNQEEFSEIKNIIYRRTPEICKAVLIK
jgi:hypothetical protein